MGGCPPRPEDLLAVCPDLSLNQEESGSSPEACAVLAAPLPVQMWHFRGDFVLHRWAGPCWDSSRQGKG